MYFFNPLTKALMLIMPVYTHTHMYVCIFYFKSEGFKVITDFKL